MVSQRALTWEGLLNGSGAYPTVNRHMIRALINAGYAVVPNVHNVGLEITPTLVQFVYPIHAPNVRHALNVGIGIWEFTGALGVPESFVEAFKAFDLICAPSAWVADQFRRVTKTPVKVIQLGYDPDEFSPKGHVADWSALFPGETWMHEAAKVLLWVGGTDPRHGFDVAVRMMDHLPASYHLVAKQSVHYPPTLTPHERVHVLRADLPSLAPLYRACDVFVHTARGVGFSLPVLDALACNAQVVSTDLPPVREYAPAERCTLVDAGQWEPMGIHHVHKDCLPVWFEPDPEALAAAVLGQRDNGWAHAAWARHWTWAQAAGRLGDVLHGAD